RARGGLAGMAIVEEDEGLLGLLVQRANLVRPFLELRLGIEVVVAEETSVALAGRRFDARAFAFSRRPFAPLAFILPARRTVVPALLVPSMEPHVCERPGRARDPRQEAREIGLVHAHVTEALALEELEQVLLHPRVVPELDEERDALHPLLKLEQKPLVVLRSVERLRELGEHAAQLARAAQ